MTIRTRAWAASVLAHAAGIALLLVFGSPAPLPMPRAPVTRTHLELRPPEHHAPRPPLRLPARSQIARTFLPPERQKAIPQLTPLPPPPTIRLIDAPAPLSPPRLALPPRTFKTDSFAASALAEPSPAPRPVTAAGAFGDASVARTLAPRQTGSKTSPDFIAAEILFKPRPAYTEEARRLGIEGEVLLEIEFTAAGDVRVSRIVRGLGHGLDEAALAAAREIRFRPAWRDGAPAGSLAVIHISFQLAY